MIVMIIQLHFLVHRRHGAFAERENLGARARALRFGWRPMAASVERVVPNGRCSHNGANTEEWQRGALIFYIILNGIFDK